MNPGKTSVLANGLIWFGAGVSIAEVLAGTWDGIREYAGYFDMGRRICYPGRAENKNVIKV